MTDADDKPGEPEERFTLPEGPVQEERYPPDFIVLLFEFMEDVCNMEAHVEAAYLSLREARTDERTNGPGEGPDMERERAFWLLSSVVGAARDAARRAHEAFPEVVAYSRKERITLPEKAEGTPTPDR